MTDTLAEFEARMMKASPAQLAATFLFLKSAYSDAEYGWKNEKLEILKKVVKIRFPDL